MFLLRNKKNISIFVEKKTPYLDYESYQVLYCRLTDSLKLLKTLMNTEGAENMG